MTKYKAITSFMAIEYEVDEDMTIRKTPVGFKNWVGRKASELEKWVRLYKGRIELIQQ